MKGRARSRWQAIVPMRTTRAAPAVLACAIGSACADGAPFDRPGIAFSTGTLPAHSVVWEQGLPDFERSSYRGVTSTLYTFDSRLRIGITDSFEVQFGTAPFNQLELREAGNTDNADGRSDASFAVKAALPSSHEEFSWAMLAGVTDSSGANNFTNGTTSYDLGVALGYSLADDISAEVYVNVEHMDGSNSVTFSPNLTFALSDSTSAFVEAGVVQSGSGLDQAVVGGGFTMLVTPTVQLDLSADFGLTSKSPDVLAGFGVSVFFP